MFDFQSFIFFFVFFLYVGTVLAIYAGTITLINTIINNLNLIIMTTIIDKIKFTDKGIATFDFLVCNQYGEGLFCITVPKTRLEYFRDWCKMKNYKRQIIINL